MGAVMYLLVILPVALCQSAMTCEQCERELNSTMGQLQEKERELQDTKHQLRACQDQEISEPPTTTESMSVSATYWSTDKPTEVTWDYSTLHQYNYQAVGSVQMDGEAMRLRAQGTQLWYTTLKTLQVYTQGLSSLKNVTLEGLSRAMAVTPLPNGQLVVVDFYRGLYVLHPNGSLAQMLHEGLFFCDVVSVQGIIYALRDMYPNFFKSTVYFYHIQGGKLHTLGATTLRYRAQRMSVFHDNLFLTDMTDHNRLYQYNTLTQLLRSEGQFGKAERGTGKRGHLQGPYLCSNDQQGNVLVADYWNYRLQVWSPSNGWTVIPLAKNSGRPCDAVVSADASTMWVVEVKFQPGFVYNIVKYTKQ